MATETTTTALVPTDEGSVHALLDSLDNQQIEAMYDPTRAAQLVAGVRPDTLVYRIPIKGGRPIVGLSATGTQVLAARQGGFETLPDLLTQDTELTIQVREERDGPAREERVPGVRAIVRVRYVPTGTVFVGVDEEPLFIALRNGGRQPDDKAVVKAINKAERNALRKHFAALESVVIQFAEQAEREGRAYVTGEVDQTTAHAAAEVRGNIRRMRNLHKEPLGKERAAGFSERVKAFCAQHGLDRRQLGVQALAFVKAQWGARSLEEVPATAEEALDRWLQQHAPPEAGAAATAPAEPDPEAVAEAFRAHARTLGWEAQTVEELIEEAREEGGVQALIRLRDDTAQHAAAAARRAAEAESAPAESPDETPANRQMSLEGE